MQVSGPSSWNRFRTPAQRTERVFVGQPTETLSQFSTLASILGPCSAAGDAGAETLIVVEKASAWGGPNVAAALLVPTTALNTTLHASSGLSFSSPWVASEWLQTNAHAAMEPSSTAMVASGPRRVMCPPLGVTSASRSGSMSCLVEI